MLMTCWKCREDEIRSPSQRKPASFGGWFGLSVFNFEVIAQGMLVIPKSLGQNVFDQRTRAE